MKCDWIVIDTRTGDYWCQRCDVRQEAPTSMMSFGMMIGMMEGFKNEHKDCEQSSEVTPCCGYDLRKNHSTIGIGKDGFFHRKGCAEADKP